VRRGEVAAAAWGTRGGEATGKEGRRIYRNAETWDLASRDEETHQAGTHL
jgi:hypothetical protein